MFLPRWIFDRLSSDREQHLADLRKETTRVADTANTVINANRDLTERGLNRILAAKDAELKALVVMKDEQINFLRRECADLKQLVAHERARAEAAIDQRLTAAHGVPVRHADLQTKLAEKEVEAASAPDTKESKAPAMQDFLKVIHGAGEDDNSPEESPLERLVSIGGQPVS